MFSPTPNPTQPFFAGAFAGKTVLVTGHTGFKGAWLCEWLVELGAHVHGLALEPHSPLFHQLGLESQISHQIGDIRDAATVLGAIRQAQPDFVFHLAAQPLVRLSFREPVATYATNVMGTVHVLEALRSLEKSCVAVVVTSDKCYENREWLHGYREEDAMGGFDPYSSSKGMAELAVAAYRRSFFAGHPVKVASARAGNVIGGGDWAQDRIVPDCIRALKAGEQIGIRNPGATRPWQHVLEPLSGYLWLAACLANLPSNQSPLCSGFNFGPGRDANRTVGDLVTEVLKHWPGSWLDQSDSRAHHEANLLHLSTDKAHSLLQWAPAWTFAEAIRETVTWYKETAESPDPALFHSLLLSQIQSYSAAAKAAGLPWANGKS